MKVKNGAYKRRLGFWKRRRERILALLAAGRSQAEVGRKMDISRQRVAQIVRESQ